MLRCEHHRFDGNTTLLTDWHDLTRRVRPELALYGPEWFAAWNRTIGAREPWSGDMHIAAVYDDADGKLYGVLALAHPKVGPVRVDAVGGYFQPWRLVLADATREFEVGRVLGVHLLKSSRGVVQLGPWPTKHAAHVGLLSVFTDLQLPISQRNSAGLAIAKLPQTWDEYQDEVVGRKTLRKIGNYSRKLAREHDVEIRHTRHPSVAEAEDLLSAVSSVEQRSWLAKDPQGKLRFTHEHDRRFWTEVIRTWLVPQDFLDVWLMTIDEQPASFVFAITCGSTRYLIANQFDEAFTDYRTGSILYRQVFEEGYTRGVTSYDFGTDGLHYKAQWGAIFADQVDTLAVVTNATVGGLWKMGARLKVLMTSSPPTKIDASEPPPDSDL